jgi:ferric-dicitrate binding protein FerR (iron transport regulator)
MFDSVVQSGKVISIAPDLKHGKWFQLKRIAVAASVVGLLLVAGYWFFSSRKSGVGSQEKPVAVTHDVKAPTVARATLKLGDGRIVYLDSVGNGQLAMQGNVSVVKLENGQINYEIASSQVSRNDEIKYNTISNPRGSKVQTLTLIDGTRVWLNAESSITYPTAFVGNERKVVITGEADFVVKHNEKMPFKVIANGIEVRDIGTEFNVNAYNDEDAIKVTLLEGSVNVSRSDKANESVVIRPGEQVVAVSSGQLAVNRNVVIEQVMAWKNGLFSFDKADLETVMRQLTRWYDVEVEYQGKIPNQTFGGDMQRTLSLAQVLKVLEKSEVHFKVEDKKIIVMP